MTVLSEVKIEKNDILNMDVVAIAKAIAKRKITSLEIVQTYINHLKMINPSLNAMTEDRFSTALTEAKLADKQNESGYELGPLHGVPISIKESFDVKGMKTTGGLVHLKNNVAKKHAFVVERLVKAGAIIISKTNTPSLCFCQETDNKLYGRTNNPWNVSRTAGGSSGGEGALLGVGGAAAGVGSDIGGSIRIPSHFNGVIGFKSGKKQVRQDGHFPNISIPLQRRMASFGPMGKSVRDIKVMYELMSETTLGEKSLAETSIEILREDPPYPMAPSTIDLFNQIEEFLSVNYTTNRSIPPLLEESAQLWQEVMSIDGAKGIKKLAFPNKRSNIFMHYFQEKITKRSKTHSYLSWALIGASLFKPSKQRIKDIESIIKQGDQTLEEYLQNRLLLLPVYHQGAPKHGKVYKEIFSIRKTFRKYMPFIAYANVWGLPSLTIPVGVDENGLPLGIQIIGQIGNENRIFELGKLLTEEFRGYVRCTRLDDNML